ncbi:MAG: APC family permease [Jatrophihabitans sp.]|uniref:APC family permease n=1 Tax=Jatrophihabitans sp. TaxID=1932789 RepID=UPI003F808A2E
MRRDIGVIGLLFASVGSIIGSGWLFGALTAAQLTGPSAILSWFIAAVMMMLIGLVFAELGTMFPLSGGVVRFPHLAFGSFASYTTGWILWVAVATTAPIEVEGALQYATKYAPFTAAHQSGGETVHTLTGLGYLVAVLGMAFFVVVNYFGVRWFARINTVAVWWKLAIILIAIIAFLVTSFHGENFSDHGFATNGMHGIFTAIATGGIVFSYLGFRQGIELAGESRNPRRNIPIAVIGSLLLTAVLYIGLQVAFIGAVRPQDLASSHGWAQLDFTDAFGPLAAIATLIGIGWLAKLLYIDAIISPADTGLIYTTVTARVSYAMGRNGNAPRSLASTTRRGVPLTSLLVSFVVGLIVFLPFPSWQQLVGFVTSATVLSFGAGILTLGALRRELPDRERPFRLALGPVVPFLAFYSSNLIVYWAGWDVNWKLFLAIALGFVLLPIFHATAKGEKTPLDLRAGATWTLPWLGGLALISWLGSYPDPHKGNTGTIGFGWGFVAVFVLTAVVFWLATVVRLPRDRVEAHVAETERESQDEEAALGSAGAA